MVLLGTEPENGEEEETQTGNESVRKLRNVVCECVSVCIKCVRVSVFVSVRVYVSVCVFICVCLCVSVRECQCM